jgi:polysaccharide deacetylase family protein (PEP-CTERM system associated)
VLAYQVGEEAFREDITRAKNILESIIGEPVQGFRAPGFGITEKALWAFNVIREVGYEYDSSVFPAHRGHGGLANSLLGPHIIKTQHGALVEIPVSAVQILGRRLSFFGGGYLRLASKWLIRWGINRLHKAGNPLVVYVHPREIDSDHPRLPLGPLRRFKCYINIKSTIPKIRWLCENFRFVPMRDLVQEFLKRRNISFVKYG